MRSSCEPRLCQGLLCSRILSILPETGVEVERVVGSVFPIPTLMRNVWESCLDHPRRRTTSLPTCNSRHRQRNRYMDSFSSIARSLCSHTLPLATSQYLERPFFSRIPWATPFPLSHTSSPFSPSPYSPATQTSAQRSTGRSSDLSPHSGYEGLKRGVLFRANAC